MNTIESSLRSFLQETFYVRDAEGLASDASLVGEGIVDSTGFLELTAFLEAEYGFTVQDEEIVPENLDTLARIVAFVERKRAAATAA